MTVPGASFVLVVVQVPAPEESVAVHRTVNPAFTMTLPVGVPAAANWGETLKANVTDDSLP